jgi:hypothetical protein
VSLDYEICGIAIIIFIILIIILLICIALPLYFTARLLDEDEGLPKALGTTFLLILAFVLLSPLGLIGLIIAIIVNLLILKWVYETSWGKSLAMLIVTIIMAVVITIVVLVIAGIGIAVISGI